jgi:hypothetical protein
MFLISIAFQRNHDFQYLLLCFSHRPIDIHNIYNVKQVQLILKDELEDVPDFDEIFREDDVS